MVPAGGGFEGAEAGDVVAAHHGGVEAGDPLPYSGTLVERSLVAPVDHRRGLVCQ